MHLKEENLLAGGLLGVLHGGWDSSGIRTNSVNNNHNNNNNNHKTIQSLSSNLKEINTDAIQGGNHNIDPVSCCLAETFPSISSSTSSSSTTGTKPNTHQSKSSYPSSTCSSSFSCSDIESDIESYSSSIESDLTRGRPTPCSASSNLCHFEANCQEKNISGVCELDSKIDLETLGYYSRGPTTLASPSDSPDVKLEDRKAFLGHEGVYDTQEPPTLATNDLSPEDCDVNININYHNNNNNNNNNINDLSECGTFEKTFYDKPKILLWPLGVGGTSPDDDNGNITGERKELNTEVIKIINITEKETETGNSTVEAQEVSDSSPTAPGDANSSTEGDAKIYADGGASNVEQINKTNGNVSDSSDTTVSDIEEKMAETKVKMNDAILSSGREELSFNGRKLKHYMKQKELKDAVALNPKRYSNVDISNNMKQPNSLNLQEDVDDNRYTQIPESPIVDAYEKECLDVPEKMVREMENQAKEKALLGEKADDFIPRKKEKMELNEHMKSCGADGDAEVSPSREVKHLTDANKENAVPHRPHPTSDKTRAGRAVTWGGVEECSMTASSVIRRREWSPARRERTTAFRRSVPQTAAPRERNPLGSPDMGEFDVYTMETAMPKIDWEAIEAHLRATRDEERRRRNDREEIRRKLAMGVDDEFSAENRPMRKPSLQSRLQSGMNLQICFMNETASDCESQCSDTESTQDRVDDDTVSTSSCSKATTPQTSQLLGKSQTKLPPGDADQENGEADFFTRQARLQAEARLALAQAKEMARMQMEIERQNKKKSPIAEIVRESFNKIGIPFPDSKRRISRQILIDMNVAQLQVIVNDLHTQIESLNEDLVNLLMERDDLHMEQDSMLVDIEDLTKHLGAKEGMLRVPKDGSSTSSPSPSTSLRSLQGMSPKTKSRSIKLKGLVKK
ncbi:schwannomin interacting protein 1 isoform X2 [Oratosquilla oratoria]